MIRRLIILLAMFLGLINCKTENKSYNIRGHCFSRTFDMTEQKICINDNSFSFYDKTALEEDFYIKGNLVRKGDTLILNVNTFTNRFNDLKRIILLDKKNSLQLLTGLKLNDLDFKQIENLDVN